MSPSPTHHPTSPYNATLPRNSLLLLRAAVAAGSLSHRSAISGLTSNSVNSEGAQIVDYLYSESEATDRETFMRQQTLRLLKKSQSLRKSDIPDSLTVSNNVIDLLSEIDSELETLRNKELSKRSNAGWRGFFSSRSRSKSKGRKNSRGNSGSLAKR